LAQGCGAFLIGNEQLERLWKPTKNSLPPNSPNSSLELFQRTTLASLRVKVGDLSHDFQFFSKVNRSDNPAIPDSKTVDNSFKIAMVQYFIGRSKGLHSLGGNGLKVSKGNPWEHESSAGTLLSKAARPATPATVSSRKNEIFLH